MKTITLQTTPIPLNALYRSVNGRNILSQRGRETKEALAWEVRSQWRGEPTNEPVTLNILMYFGDRRKRDIDAYLKVLLDSLNDIVYGDDSQVVELHVFKQVDVENPRTVLQVM